MNGLTITHPHNGNDKSMNHETALKILIKKRGGGVIERFSHESMKINIFHVLTVLVTLLSIKL